jgi:glycosyltransferase involved in cell wall biosynthesis
LISSEKKVVECIEGSTFFQFNEAIKKDSNSFLWVGRLDKNKDPLSVLKAFSNYIKIKPTAKLIMFFEDTTLLNEVEQIIIDLSLKNHVFSKGAVSNSSLELWFQKSEFFILGSHKEGGPFSLIEAMACGCVPVVSKIPAHVAITNHGRCGYLFEAGNSNSLFNVLKGIQQEEIIKKRKETILFFKNELSHEAIAEKIKAISI